MHDEYQDTVRPDISYAAPQAKPGCAQWKKELVGYQGAGQVRFFLRMNEGSCEQDRSKREHSQIGVP